MINPILEPIGLALDPRAALLNHSCDPNAYVRFDISPPSVPTSHALYGSITVITLRPIAQDEQITIAYIDPTIPFAQRQRDLKTRYHFQCRCHLCLPGHVSTAQDNIIKLQESAQQHLRQVHVGDEGRHVDSIRASMSELARSNAFEIHHYPWPQLRKQMLIGLLQLESFENAFIQCGILVRKIHPLLYTDETHPVCLAELWTLSQIGLHLIGINRNVVYVIFAAVQLLQTRLSQGERASGQFEVMVDMMMNKVKLHQQAWRNFVKDPARPWLWLDGLIEANLDREGSQNDDAGLLQTV